MVAFAGFGKAYLKYKKAKALAKMKAGTSTRKERLEFGKRDKDITKVDVSKDVKKGDVKESVKKGRQHFYIKNIDEVDKHKKVLKEGKKAKKKLQHMQDTKRAFTIGSGKNKSIHASNPDKGSKEWNK